MKKLVRESLDESISTNLKSFWKYGPDRTDQKYKNDIVDLIHELSLNNDEVHLFDEGLNRKY